MTRVIGAVPAAVTVAGAAGQVLAQWPEPPSGQSDTCGPAACDQMVGRGMSTQGMRDQDMMGGDMAAMMRQCQHMMQAMRRPATGHEGQRSGTAPQEGSSR